MQRSQKKKAKRREFDSPWKLALDAYFEDFMAFCWPALHREIDWSKGYKSLDKELSKITGKSLGGDRRVDKLIEVYLKTGAKTLILMHCEVQFIPEIHLPKRMYIYNALLQHIYQTPIVSLAILIDGQESWRPDTYYSEFWDTYIKMGFKTIKLLDYRKRISELKASNNRFATVILAQLCAIEKNDTNNKLLSKITLTRELYSKNWKKEDIKQLFNFIDWLIMLPSKFEIKYNAEVDKIQEKQTVRPYTSRERILIETSHEEGLEQGIMQGIEQGLTKGETSFLLKLLSRKFNNVPQAYQERIQQADSNDILLWAERLLNCNTLEQVFES